MIRPLLLAALLFFAATPALAAERNFGIASFERVRIDGPFEVRIATGAAPSARASGDQRMLDRVRLDANGTTLVVRMNSGGWNDAPRGAGGAPPVIVLTTPRLVSAGLTAGARVTIAGMKAQRVDLAVSGSGALDVSRVEADQLVATLIGTGQVTLAGRSGRASLLTNGSGTIDAGGLAVNDLTVRQDGAGETRAAARYTAQVNSTGLGRVTVTGPAKCVVKAQVDGPVRCGVGK